MIFEEVTIGKCRLILGDCVDVLQSLEAQSVDAVITDPPFFHPVNHYVNARDAEPAKKTLSDMSALKHFFRVTAVELDRVLKRSGSAYWFCDGQSYGHSFEALYPHFKRVRPLIWDKVVSFNGYTWRHQHELIAWGEMPEAKQIPTGDGDIIRCRAVPVKERVHPAEKPVDLLAALVKKTPSDAVVLDCFMGSASTGVAAVMHGRGFVGIEFERRYFDIACQRIEDAQSKVGFGGTAEQGDLLTANTNVTGLAPTQENDK